MAFISLINYSMDMTASIHTSAICPSGIHLASTKAYPHTNGCEDSYSKTGCVSVLLTTNLSLTSTLLTNSESIRRDVLGYLQNKDSSTTTCIACQLLEHRALSWLVCLSDGKSCCWQSLSVRLVLFLACTFAPPLYLACE